VKKSAFGILSFLLVLSATSLVVLASEQYSAVTVQPKTARMNPATQLTIQVDRYTSDSERKGYIQLLKDKGPEALLSTMNEVNVGRISAPGQVGVAVAAARVRETEGGKRVRLVITRPASFLQARRAERVDEFPYTIMDLYLDANGKGNGSVLSALRIYFDDDGQLHLQGLGGDPIDLINVKKE